MPVARTATARAKNALPAEPAARYVLRFVAAKAEPELESIFLLTGGTLDAAAARAHTDFSVTHSGVTTTTLITDVPQSVEVPLSPALIEASARLFAEETGGAALSTTDEAGPVLLLADAAQLLVTGTRLGAGITGTVASSFCGGGCASLASLFTTVDAERVVVPVLLKRDADAMGGVDGGGDGAPVVSDDASDGSEAEAESGGRLLSASDARQAPAFVQIPLQYPNWPAHISVVTVASPRVLRVDPVSGEETEVSVLFFGGAQQEARRAEVYEVLGDLYVQSTRTAQLAIFTPAPDLTKVFTNKTYGFGGSPFALSSETNDAPFSARPRTYEDALMRLLTVHMGGEAARDALLERLRTPSHAAARAHAAHVASVISGFAAWAMPYKYDGSQVVTPTGLEFEQSEAWPIDAVRQLGLFTDDCDGSAGLCMTVVRMAAETVVASTTGGDDFPALRAVHHTLGHFYCSGTAILAANASHASEADDESHEIGGHAILIALPKDVVLQSLDRGERASLGDDQAAPTKARADEVADARFRALFPEALVARLPASERKHFASYATLMASPLVDPVEGLQTVVCEGTAYADATLYTHAVDERKARLEASTRSTVASHKLEPNITQPYRIMDVGASLTHTFYENFIESGLSLTSPLYTDPRLRALGCATAVLRLTKLPAGTPPRLYASGVTPAELGLRTFAATPLWTIDARQAALMDAAHADSYANTAPRRDGPYQMTPAEVETVKGSLAKLRALATKSTTTTTTKPEMTCLVTFASLVGNPAAIAAFCDNVAAQAANVAVRVNGLDVPVRDLAVDERGAQYGRIVSIDVYTAAA